MRSSAGKPLSVGSPTAPDRQPLHLTIQPSLPTGLLASPCCTPAAQLLPISESISPIRRYRTVLCFWTWHTNMWQQPSRLGCSFDRYPLLSISAFIYTSMHHRRFVSTSNTPTPSLNTHGSFSFAISFFHVLLYQYHPEFVYFSWGAHTGFLGRHGLR